MDFDNVRKPMRDLRVPIFLAALLFLWVLGTGACVAATPLAQARPAKEADELMIKGAAAFDAGDFGAAVDLWRNAQAEYDRRKRPDGRCDAEINLSVAYQSLGQYSQAKESLLDAQSLSQSLKDQPRELRVLRGLIDLYTLTRQSDDARQCVAEALAIAAKLDDAKGQAGVLNAKGNLEMSQGLYDQAMKSYLNAAGAAPPWEREMVCMAMTNAALAAGRCGLPDNARMFAGEAVPDIMHMADGREKVSMLLTAARAIDSNDPPDAQRLDQMASDAAAASGDSVGQSYALGYLGESMATRHRDDDALRYFRQAAFVAQQAQAADPLYRWQREIGKILASRGDIELASVAYANAIDSLQSIRHDLSFGYGNQAYVGSFRDTVASIYYEAADVILQRADRQRDPQQAQLLLRQARQTVETLKSAELEDYFQDSCTNILRRESRPIDTVAANTAVVYIIPLADRTEILLGTGQGLREFKAPVGADELLKEVRLFRERLEDRTTRRYMLNSQRIYDWLIRPIEPALAQNHTDTLVFVPDGALRTIPMGALSDGKSFLIERYAIAVSPGLTLMDPRPVGRQTASVLASGLSRSVAGFPALPYVPSELKSVQALFGGQILLNDQFVESRLRQELIDHEYSIVHLASHAEFGDDAQHTFLLAYDRKISLDDVATIVQPSLFRAHPIELLTLSACQTAAGDDRAALGLAGIAIKAGARSAVATLWSVNDQVSAQLIADFYGSLKEQPTLSKAKAMRQAQLKLIADMRFRHPAYWSPYLVIGNWL